MQVNSNVTFNAYEGALSAPPLTLASTGPTPLASNLPESTLVTNPSTVPDQYQAQSNSKIDVKKALETIGQNTIINIGVGGGATVPSSQGSITNSPLPVPNGTGATSGNSVSDKFLESFSKMLEGFLTNLNKLLDSFLNKMTDLVGKNSSQGTPFSASSTSSSSLPTNSTTTPNRNLKTWEQKASEYIKADEKGMVAESDLQEAVAKFQIYQKSEQGESIFIQELEKAKATTTSRQSALKTALKNTVASGAITQAEADFVYSISFNASQFDSVLDKISTAKSTGGLSAQNAIQLGAVNLTRIQAGETKPEARSINSLSTD